VPNNGPEVVLDNLG
jgi:hypothetical protein